MPLQVLGKRYVRVYSPETELYCFQHLTSEQIATLVLRGYQIHEVEDWRTPRLRARVDDMLVDMTVMLGNFISDAYGDNEISRIAGQNYADGLMMGLTVMLDSLGIKLEDTATDRVENLLETLVARIIDKIHAHVREQKGISSS